MEGPHSMIDACVSEVLKRGLDDWIQAAEVASVAKSIQKQATSADVRRVALGVIAEVLQNELMTAGDVTNEGFSEWSVTSTEALERITKAWNALDRLPELGEICWLSNTSKGDQRARLAP